LQGAQLNYEIGKIKPADQESAREVIEGGMSELGLALRPRDLDSDVADLANHYSNPGRALFVARAEGGRVIGTCGVEVMPEDGATLRRWYTIPDARGHGVGSALLQEVLAFARANGVSYLWVHTPETNSAGLTKYLQLGFRRVEVPAHVAHYYLVPGRPPNVRLQINLA
jgi:putative acetyltransferase